jgi:hypothetical protein
MFSLIGMGAMAGVALIVDRRSRSHAATARVTKKKP